MTGKAAGNRKREAAGEKTLPSPAVQTFYYRKKMKRKVQGQAIPARKGSNMKWENMRRNVYPALLWAARNEEQLKFLPHEKLLDLAVIYLVRGETESKYCLSVKVTYSLLKHWGISMETLRETAFANQRKDCRVYSMEEAVKMAGNGEWPEGERQMRTERTLEPETCYVLTNSRGAWGAAVMADGELMKELLGDRNYFVIPSSIHEVLLAPDNGHLDRKKIDEMIREVNRSVVAKEEWLGDHCYLYNKCSGLVV